MRLLRTADRGVLGVLKGSGAGVSIVDESGAHTVVAPESDGGLWLDAQRVSLTQAAPLWNADSATYTRLAIDPVTRSVVNLGAAGNDEVCGAGRWMRWSPGHLVWNYPAQPPEGHAPGDIDPETGTGATIVANSRGGHDVAVWNDQGVEIGRMSFAAGVVYVLCRAGLVVAVAADQSMQTARVLGVDVMLTASPAVLMPYVAPVPVEIDGALWAVYGVWGRLVDALVAHPWMDAARGIVIARDRTAWGYDAIADGAQLVAGWCVGAGEHPGEGRLARVEVGALVDLRAALTPSVHVPSFPRPPAPAIVMASSQPGATLRLTWFDPDPARTDPTPRDPSVCGVFISAEGAAVRPEFLAAWPLAIRGARDLDLPLHLHWDGAGYGLLEQAREARAAGVRVIPSVSGYPAKLGGQMVPVAESVAAFRATVASLLEEWPVLACWIACYSQWDPASETFSWWPWQHVLDQAAAIWDAANDLGVQYRSLFDWVRPGAIAGPTPMPGARAMADQMLAFTTRTRLPWPSAPPPHVPPPPTPEDPMPYSRDDLVAFAFGNAYLELIDFTKTHPDFQAIANDRDRVFAACRWVMESWDAVVAHPNAEGYGTAIRQWTTGESFRHLATRMQLELRPGVAPEF